MSMYCGIYDSEFTGRVFGEGFSIHPWNGIHADSTGIPKVKSDFKLTAILEVDDAKKDQLPFELASILTFCEQQKVIVTSPVDATDSRHATCIFPHTLNIGVNRDLSLKLKRRCKIIPDFGSPEKSIELINLLLRKLHDPDLLGGGGKFQRAFLFQVENFQQNIRYLEISYFLEFVAMEMLARSYTRKLKNKKKSRRADVHYA